MRSVVSGLLAAFMLAAPASADIITATITASPDTVYLNEPTEIDVTVSVASGIDPGTGLIIEGTSAGFLSIQDGLGNEIVGFFLGGQIAGSSLLYSGRVAYQTVGDFYPSFAWGGTISENNSQNDPFNVIWRVGRSLSGETTVHVADVPGPVVGAGLPGLILAGLGLLGWRKRRVMAGVSC